MTDEQIDNIVNSCGFALTSPEWAQLRSMLLDVRAAVEQATARECAELCEQRAREMMSQGITSGPALEADLCGGHIRVRFGVVRPPAGEKRKGEASGE